MDQSFSSVSDALPVVKQRTATGGGHTSKAESSVAFSSSTAAVIAATTVQFSHMVRCALDEMFKLVFIASDHQSRLHDNSEKTVDALLHMFLPLCRSPPHPSTTFDAPSASEATLVVKEHRITAQGHLANAQRTHVQLQVAICGIAQLLEELSKNAVFATAAAAASSNNSDDALGSPVGSGGTPTRGGSFLNSRVSFRLDPSAPSDDDTNVGGGRHGGGGGGGTGCATPTDSMEGEVTPFPPPPPPTRAVVSGGGAATKTPPPPPPSALRGSAAGVAVGVGGSRAANSQPGPSAATHSSYVATTSRPDTAASTASSSRGGPPPPVDLDWMRPGTSSSSAGTPRSQQQSHSTTSPSAAAPPPNRVMTDAPLTRSNTLPPQFEEPTTTLRVAPSSSSSSTGRGNQVPAAPQPPGHVKEPPVAAITGVAAVSTTTTVTAATPSSLSDRSAAVLAVKVVSPTAVRGTPPSVPLPTTTSASPRTPGAGLSVTSATADLLSRIEASTRARQSQVDAIYAVSPGARGRSASPLAKTPAGDRGTAAVEPPRVVDNVTPPRGSPPQPRGASSSSPAADFDARMRALEDHRRSIERRLGLRDDPRTPQRLMSGPRQGA